MHMKQHKNGDVSFWFSSDLCVAIKFAGYDAVNYFVRYEKGRWVARPMTSGVFKHWYYSKSSTLWDTEEYCKVSDFDFLSQVELLRDLY